MNLWIIATIISTFFGGTASMLMKKVSQDYEDNYLALVFQYIAMAIVAIILWAGRAIYHGTLFLPSLSFRQRLLVSIVGIVWYIGIALLFQAYDHLCGGVALVIANLATFLMYFANLSLYPGQESFNTPKLILAIIFFVIIAQFLIDQGSCPTDHKSLVNKYTLYPLWTALCWAIFFVGNSYFIKSNMMSPVQSGMLTETMILFVAVAWFFILRGKQSLIKVKQCMGNDKSSFFFIGFFNIVAVYLAYYGYQNNPANTVNVIRLFSIPCAALMCWVFLKDQLNRKQTILLIAACGVMAAFLIL